MAATPPREPDHKQLEARQHLPLVDRRAVRIADQAVARIVDLAVARTAGLSGQPTQLHASPPRPLVRIRRRVHLPHRVPAATDSLVAAAIPALLADTRGPLAAIPEGVGAGADTTAELRNYGRGSATGTCPLAYARGYNSGKRRSQSSPARQQGDQYFTASHRRGSAPLRNRERIRPVPLISFTARKFRFLPPKPR
jgi:hypothetical protein